MSLSYFEVSAPGVGSYRFHIENKGIIDVNQGDLRGVSVNRPQVIQLSGVGSLKTDVNFSNLVGGGRYIYGSVVQQREISFALWFPTQKSYKESRSFLESAMSLGQDPGNNKNLNSRSNQVTITFNTHSKDKYSIYGYFTEVKVDLFTDEPILWASFICSEDEFESTIRGTSSEPVLKQHFGYDRFSIVNKVTVAEKVDVKEGNITLSSRFFKLPSGWNKYSNKFLSNNTIGVSFDVKDPVKIYGIKLEIFEDESGKDRGHNQMVHLRGFDPTSFPSGVKYMFTRLNGGDTFMDTIRVICFDSGGVFSGKELKNYTVSDAYDREDGEYPFKDFSLKNDDSSGIRVYALDSASLPSKVSMWIDSPNPDYGDRTIYKDSILDV